MENGARKRREEEKRNRGKKLVLCTPGRHDGNSVVVRIPRKQRSGGEEWKELVMVGMEVAVSRVATKTSVSTCHRITCK
jgi:hypothetical protein